MINGSVHHIDINILNMYEQSINNMEQNLIQLKGNRVTAVPGDFNTPFSVIERQSRKKNSKGVSLNTTKNLI